MKFRPVFLMLLLALLLAGCRQEETTALAVVFGRETVLAVREGSSLVVCRMPSSLVDGYVAHTGLDEGKALSALFGIPEPTVLVSDASRQAVLENLLTTLAAETSKTAREDVDDALRLDALVRHAPHLRKTAFGDTLQALVDGPGALALFVGNPDHHMYDLGTFLAIDAVTDWDALALHMNRWMHQALTLDRRRENR